MTQRVNMEELMSQQDNEKTFEVGDSVYDNSTCTFVDVFEVGPDDEYTGVAVKVGCCAAVAYWVPATVLEKDDWS